MYFDDFKFTHVKSNIVAGADYYPFGLPMENREITREDYRYGYQGQYSEKDRETGWNAFELRMYDARIGRTTTTDPYGQFASPYTWVGNNPVSSVDPNGGLSIGLAWRLGGAIVGGVTGGFIDQDNPARGAAIGFGLGFAAGHGLSKVNFAGVGKSLNNLYAKLGDFIDDIDLSSNALKFTKEAMGAVARRAAEEYFVRSKYRDKDYSGLKKDYKLTTDSEGDYYSGFAEPGGLNANYYLGNDSGPYKVKDPDTKLEVRISRNFAKTNLNVAYVSKLTYVSGFGQNNLILEGWGYYLEPMSRSNPSKVSVAFNSKQSALKFHNKYYGNEFKSKLAQMHKTYHVK